MKNIRKLTDDKHWFIDWYQEWSQLWEGCNWYDFTICHIAFENDKIMGGVEATFVLFGLGLRWRWNHTRTEQMAEVEQAVAEIKAGTARTRPWAEAEEELTKDDSDVVR